MSTRDDATERQVQAARPDASTWLSANAGSGKTRVLTDRVARLLLAGVDPQNILCLTYTKAAASEMQNRLFRRLGEWAMLEDGALHGQLDLLGVEGAITPERMRHARTLFARAIEAPGGLKIQTIHSFCASLLRRFPLEAGVSPQFSEMETRAARLLCAEIVEQMAEGEDAPLIEGLARHASGAGLDDVLASVLQYRAALTPPMTFDGLLGAFGLPSGFDDAALLAQVFLGGEAELLRDLHAALMAGSKTDVKAGEALAAVIDKPAPEAETLAVLEQIMLTGASAREPFTAKLGSFPTKKTQEACAAILPRLNDLMTRVESARPARLGLLAARKSAALHRFATRFLPEYERRKQLRGWLDFDDQIQKARQLLNNPAVAAWVLYRLDGGIDHILVDEAQDTSPEQWDVIEKLAQEFTSGAGAREGVERTIFVVGDKKQSIYSFQGADPQAFDRMQAEFGDRLRASGGNLEDLTLEFSFRSAQSILRLVDLVFDGKAAAGFHKDSQHRAFQRDLPGRIDLWPVVDKTSEDDDRHWTDPVDRPSPRRHTVELAERIAGEIRRLIDAGETIPAQGQGGLIRRPVRAGDFLVLVQRRSDLFAEIIRACKAANLPIAGADRLKVGAELAVKDLAALLRFLATPEDDLSLAIALKSPLFGWTEQELFSLAHDRGRTYLWQTLRDQGARHSETVATLTDLMAQSDFLRPYDLIERVLTRHHGRNRLLARLGVEAEDGINALLSQALAYERTDVPSLTGFLTWMEADALEIKRELGSAGDMIRVMTVHGAKGLESPIVILPDTAKRAYQNRGDILALDGVPMWRPAAAQMPPALTEAAQAIRDKDMNERQRLLYVALTRAEKWLIVAAAGDLDKEGDSWYQQVEAAMRDSGAVDRDLPGGIGLSVQGDGWDDLPVQVPEEVEKKTVDLPDVFNLPAPIPVPPLETLSPSDLGGAKALPGDMGEEEDAAKLRGTRIHRLIEVLAGSDPSTRENVTERLLPGTDSATRAALLAEASAVIDAPELAHLFGPDTLAEVPVTAQIGARRVHGVIDRLIVTPTTVLAVDFKTNATVPPTPEATPEGLLRQMFAYAHALKQIFPDHQIDTAILWTRTATFMSLPQDIVMSAGSRTPHLDLPDGPA
ncbi:double-strand break repair helicase AddA [Arenibacterium halophilum]|uniref:DNA 3'-5' helicase n=1 Tax=Arenibacterium halophilum TaxID=2583821 RepID=A0ABY2X5N0_9RHOB|nr:double-strand break repair helicase AddA [Arenibacterium halophilum]TMV10759.1 double-strand break repair helicase AddA [Arenibacterium halophilum]